MINTNIANKINELFNIKDNFNTEKVLSVTEPNKFVLAAPEEIRVRNGWDVSYDVDYEDNDMKIVVDRNMDLVSQWNGEELSSIDVWALDKSTNIWWHANLDVDGNAYIWNYSKEYIDKNVANNGY